ncbi:MAG: ribosomal RNA small subunit methyltransferase A, partial [Desulforhopalus sp.]
TLIDNAEVIDTVTVMLQKEVAERLMAQPNCKDYGVPTILLASCATVRKVMTLRPEEFHPRPKVDSVVVSIDFRNRLQLPGGAEIYNYKILRKIVRATFNQRRKTIQNTLSSSAIFGTSLKQDKHLNKEYAANAIARAGLQPNARPETLAITDFIRLAIEVEKIILPGEQG